MTVELAENEAEEDEPEKDKPDKGGVEKAEPGQRKGPNGAEKILEDFP